MNLKKNTCIKYPRGFSVQSLIMIKKMYNIPSWMCNDECTVPPPPGNFNTFKESNVIMLRKNKLIKKQT